MIEKTVEQKLSQIQKSAKSRDYVCSLTYRNVQNLMNETVCQYTGVPFDNKKNARTFERIDNRLGYIPGNVIPVTAEANKLKDNLSTDQLRDRADIIEKQNQKHKDHIEKLIESTIGKRDRRLAQIEELHKLIARDELAIERLKKDLASAEKEEAANIERAEILRSIAVTIEEKPKIADKYNTWDQNVMIFVSKLFKWKKS